MFLITVISKINEIEFPKKLLFVTLKKKSISNIQKERNIKSWRALVLVMRENEHKIYMHISQY